MFFKIIWKRNKIKINDVKKVNNLNKDVEEYPNKNKKIDSDLHNNSSKKELLKNLSDKIKLTGIFNNTKSSSNF